MQQNYLTLVFFKLNHFPWIFKASQWPNCWLSNWSIDCQLLSRTRKQSGFHHCCDSHPFFVLLGRMTSKPIDNPPFLFLKWIIELSITPDADSEQNDQLLWDSHSWIVPRKKKRGPNFLPDVPRNGHKHVCLSSLDLLLSQQGGPLSLLHMTQTPITLLSLVGTAQVERCTAGVEVHVCCLLIQG